MFGKDQAQRAEGGSTAIQAGGDVTIHGLSVSEVRELCALFLQNNFPQLREEAKRAAEEHVRSFAKILESRLVSDAASIVLEKFRDPDVQATINDAVQATARKGDAASPEVLCALISERVARSTDDFRATVLSEAVQVVQRLTGPQISLLAFTHCIRSMVLQGITDIRALEPFGRKAILFSSSGFGLSQAQKQHLQYAGTASVNNMFGGDAFNSLFEAYKHLRIADGESFEKELAAKAPSYHRLLKQFNDDGLFSVELTSVGQAIALAHASKYLGKLDYSTWLK